MANTKPQAMTSERLAEIKRLGYHQEKYTAGEMGPTDELNIDLALRDLLADNERLRAHEAALMEIVRAVAEAGQERMFSAGGNDYATYVLPHKIGERAGALLAGPESET